MSQKSSSKSSDKSNGIVDVCKTCPSGYVCKTCLSSKLSQTTSGARVHDTYINILPRSLPPKPQSLPPKLGTDIAYHAGELVNAFAGDQARSCDSCGSTDSCDCFDSTDSCDSFDSANRCDSPLENVEDLEIFDDSPNLQEDEQEPDIDGQDQEVEQEPHHDGQDQQEHNRETELHDDIDGQEPTDYDCNNTEYEQENHDYNTDQEHQTADEISQSWNCDTDTSYYEQDNSY
jgi:hypothetical protein